jgi:hypothetical protein
MDFTGRRFFYALKCLFYTVLDDYPGYLPAIQTAILLLIGVMQGDVHIKNNTCPKSKSAFCNR